jgi:hypothetical protein
MSRIATLPPSRVVIGVDPAVPNGDQCIVELWYDGPTLIASVAYGTHVGAASCVIVDEAEAVIDATAEVVEG